MKWIDAKFLDEQWSSTHAAEGMLPELVRDLIHGSVDDLSKIHEIRFPVGDMDRIPGYDGKLEIDGTFNAFIPNGKSVWEIKTSKSYISAANDDFEKRSKNPEGIDKSITTYVCVTSKAWKNGKEGKDDWITEKKTQDPNWKDIKVIDAVDLEQWIEWCPGVGANFAKKTEKSPQMGAQGTEEFWDRFVNRYGPAISEEVILTSRKDQAHDFVAKLMAERSLHRIHADSVDEVIAFVIGAINSSKEDVKARLKAKTLILHNEDAAKFFSNLQGMIFIVSPHIAQSCGNLLIKNTLIVPAGRKGIKNDCLTLIRPTVYELSESLKKIGYKEDDAVRAAKECGGSITILSRRRPSVSSKEPEWIKSHGKSLIPAMLAGGWDENNDHDPSALSSLAAKEKYEDYQEEIVSTLSLEESPIEREGSIWKMIAPVDAFVSLGSQISINDYERLKKVSTEVFSEIDPNLEEPNENEVYSGFSKKPYKYSAWLRDGLATTLLQIAALHEELGLHIPKTTPQRFVNDLIASLPGLKNDPRVIMSLKNELPLLMEAAPLPFLEALEQMLEGKTNVLQVVFDEKEDFLFPTSNHHNLLWGLEGLAWDPALLKRVSLILARLAQIDPGGKTINRPINSLREIFLLWHPGTNANMNQRFSVIDTLIKEEPDVAWDLIEKILPEYHSSSHNTHKPLYREAESSDVEVLTWGVIWKSHREIIERAIKLAGQAPEKWKLILETLALLKPDLRSEVIEKFILATGQMNKEQKTSSWNVLRDFVHRNLSFPDADWVLSKEELTTLNGFLPALEPSNLLQKFKWLFDDHHPDLADSKDDFEKSEEKLKGERASAIVSIYDALGVEGVLNFAELVAEPQIISSTYAELGYGFEVYLETIKLAHGKSEKLSHFCFALSSSLQYQTSDWKAPLLEIIRDASWSNSLKAQLILAWPDIRDTWDAAESLGNDVEEIYWRQKRAWGGRNLGIADVEYYARKLLSYQRAIAAIEVVHEHANKISLQLVYEILDQAVSEINKLEGSNNTMLGYYIEKIFDALTARNDVNENDLAAREYAYLAFLERRSNTLTLHNLLAKDPNFYMSVICDVFKPRNSEGNASTEENRRKAQAAYRLLNSFKKIPGSVENIIDLGTLRSWTHEVLRLAKEKDRIEITKQQIGSLLAHAPADPEDGAWPHKTVRELLEELSSDEVETGISIERFNMRGVYSKAMYEGGRQERELAAQAYGWAGKSKNWPRTHNLLTKVSKEWDAHAIAEDRRAKLDRMKS